MVGRGASCSEDQRHQTKDDCWLAFGLMALGLQILNGYDGSRGGLHPSARLNSLTMVRNNSVSHYRGSMQIAKDRIDTSPWLL